MKKVIGWGVLGILRSTVFAITLMKTPAEISNMLTDITAQLKIYSLIVHCLFLATVMGKDNLCHLFHLHSFSWSVTF
jgi:hypothetical protein